MFPQEAWSVGTFFFPSVLHCRMKFLVSVTFLHCIVTYSWRKWREETPCAITIFPSSLHVLWRWSYYRLVPRWVLFWGELWFHKHYIYEVAILENSIMYMMASSCLWKAVNALNRKCASRGKRKAEDPAEEKEEPTVAGQGAVSLILCTSPGAC